MILFLQNKDRVTDNGFHGTKVENLTVMNEYSMACNVCVDRFFLKFGGHEF